MNFSTFNGPRPRKFRCLPHFIVWSACFGLWCGVSQVGLAETTLPEYQVKALFLLNFTKYVDWPPHTFARSDTPITIGIFGDSKLGEALKNIGAARTTSNRAIVIRQIENMEDASQCQVLFISHAAAARAPAMLDKTSGLPILTVGEDPAFAQNGGIINFVLRDGNVRLEIDLVGARKAGLTLSSRLLAVADLVKRTTN
jgi:hypothetical protein